MNTEERITQLESQVRELLQWKADRIKQQITFPLDSISKDILNQDFLRIFSTYILVGGAAGREFTNFFVKQAGFIGSIPQSTLTPFTVNATTNVLTTTIRKFNDDDRVYVVTSDTLPSPLDNITTYYIISSTGNTFKLSLTVGGAEINITDAGTGIQYIDYL